MCVRNFDDEYGEGLRNNNFKLSIDGIVTLLTDELKLDVDVSSIQRAMILCKGVPLPDNELSLIEIPDNGLVHKRSGARVYGSVDLTFHNAPNQIAHNIFTTLQDASSYYGDCGKLITHTYPFDAKLIQYDTSGNPIAGWKLVKNVLSNVGNPQFDRSDTEGVQEFNVTLNPLIIKKIPLGELGLAIEEADKWLSLFTNLDKTSFINSFKK